MCKHFGNFSAGFEWNLSKTKTSRGAHLELQNNWQLNYQSPKRKEYVVDNKV